MSYKPGFRGFSKASGHAEQWDEIDPRKSEQSGWRTGKNDSAYSVDTLIGNWNEQRFDVSNISKRRSLPSQYGHCYETTNRKDYTPTHHPTSAHTYRYCMATGEGPKSFPGHQPSLDPPDVQKQYQQFVTTAMEAFGTPTKEGGASMNTAATS